MTTPLEVKICAQCSVTPAVAGGLIEWYLDELIPPGHLKALRVAEESERQAINLLANSF